MHSKRADLGLMYKIIYGAIVVAGLIKAKLVASCLEFNIELAKKNNTPSKTKVPTCASNGRQ